MVIQREWQDALEDHLKLVNCSSDFAEWGDIYYKKARPSNGWMGMSEIAANRDFCYVIKRDSQKGGNTADKKKIVWFLAVRCFQKRLIAQRDQLSQKNYQDI